MASLNLLDLELFEDINTVMADAWNGCVGPDEPFARHEFLRALEESGSVSSKNGWLAQHLGLRDEDGTLKVAIPMYLKSHSYGEYVFDWSWADAYQRAGGRYYPKLQSAIPFTPVTGNRLLCHPDADDQLREAAIDGLLDRAKKINTSSLHITFCPKTEWDLLGRKGLLKRTGHQYHWENKDYQTFDDFLSELSSRKRKAIRKERKKFNDTDFTILPLSGSDITEAHWDAFYAFYLDTSGKKWGHAYLNREFFSLLGHYLGEAVVLMMVEKDGRFVAGALNMKGSETLFGRYWGCLEDYKFLHFETCYYRAIDYAIEQGLKRVEAGAQGQHKIQRGYLPVETYSAHWIADPGFEKAIADFLLRDKAQNDFEMRELMKLSPFKKFE